MELTLEQKALIKELKTRLRREIINRDCEEAHENADDILVELLVVLGFTDFTNIYENICKWYS